jgi:hypothetical protein
MLYRVDAHAHNISSPINLKEWQNLCNKHIKILCKNILYLLLFIIILFIINLFTYGRFTTADMRK